MDLKLRVNKLTIENGIAVIQLIPSIEEARAGDVVAGELFLTTSVQNMVLDMDGEIVVSFAEEVTEEPII